MLKSLVDNFHFKSHLILSTLPPKEAEFIRSSMVFRKYNKGQSIFVEGTYPSGVYFVKKGCVKKFKLNNNGKEHIFYICTEGEFLGYPALLSGETYSDSAAAIENCEIGYIPQEAFFKLLEDSKKFARQLLRNLSHEFGVLINNIAVYKNNSGKERLALFLIFLKEKFASPSNPNPEIGLSRENLANLVGVAVETLIRLLNDLKADGLITTKGRKIRITNPDKLLALISS